MLSSRVNDLSKTLSSQDDTDLKDSESAGNGTRCPRWKAPDSGALDDSPLWKNMVDSSGSTSNINDYVVHQQDIEAVVNALWAGGAESMMIMDQRVLFNSAVRCSGNVLLLQGKKYSPPFTISAIGPVDNMKKALDSSQDVTIYRQYVSAFGLGWQVDEKEKSAFRRDRRAAAAAAIRAGDERRNRRNAVNGRNAAITRCAGIARGEVNDEARGTQTMP